MVEIMIREGRSLEWLKKTEESSVCFSGETQRSSKFYICSEKDYGEKKRMLLNSSNGTDIPPRGISYVPSHVCGEGREPFVSAEGLEQLHRFLFVLGITHVLYSCIVVGVSMSKVHFSSPTATLEIYSWRKWEIQAGVVAEANAQAKNKVMRRQSTFALHHASHPWSRSRVLIWMEFGSEVRLHGASIGFHHRGYSFIFDTNHKLPLSYNFHKYMVRSMEDEFYGILVMLVGTKLQHVVSLLALEIAEPRGPSVGTSQVKPRDDLFWFGKPVILLRLIQFISFQMGSRCKKALIAESVRDSLHSWCKRVKERSRTTMSVTTRSTCSLDERDEIITVASGTLSPCSSTGSLSHLDANGLPNGHGDPECGLENFNPVEHEYSFRHMQHPNETLNDDVEDNVDGIEEGKIETLLELFRKT
ncbi:hypothetical protein DH2020_045089 [Rehmannia glutinosa]|uniref:MLO-like protein n=1 Tax=Rehmannia glutinosa TaxID=99300 RepID=A0ABR0UF40_REHGL